MKPVHLLIAGFLFFGVTRGGGAVDGVQHRQELTQRTTEVQRVARTERRDSRNRERLAQVSLERVRVCVPVGRPNDVNNPSAGVIDGTLLIEGMTVSDWTGMPLSDGTPVCTRTNTGIVQNGVVSSVTNVAAADREEYLAIYQQLGGM